MWRRRRPQPVVLHHNDPEIERQLQQIRSLQQRAVAKIALLDDYRLEIAALNEGLRRYSDKLAGTGNPIWATNIQNAIDNDDRRIISPQQQMLNLEKESETIYDEIAKRQQSMSVSDLAFL